MGEVKGAAEGGLANCARKNVVQSEIHGATNRDSPLENCPDAKEKDNQAKATQETHTLTRSSQGGKRARKKQANVHDKCLAITCLRSWKNEAKRISA